MTTLISIDPGASGGIALQAIGGTNAWPMPEGMTAQVDRLRELAASFPGALVVLEKTGTHVKGNNASASAKFARHCGHLESACYCLGLPVEQVAPQVWQKALGALPHDKRERKNAIKEVMARRFPHLSVTLKTADALAILCWKLNEK